MVNKEVQLVQVIPARQGAFYITGSLLVPVDVIVYFWSEYDGRYHECPMYHGQLFDDDLDVRVASDWKEFFEEMGKASRTVLYYLAKSDVARMMRDRNWDDDNLDPIRNHVRNGIIRCTPELRNWLYSGSLDIEDCANDEWGYSR